jgi:putative FmdB family regulatory protein
MPVYVFHCGTCRAVEERLQVGFTPVVPRCEACGVFMRQVIAAPAVLFKGKGWAKRDRKAGKA